tara:strand:- start:214 stop:654 length:441 start_codon:yes stop_codon:yes gene_type:complete
MLTYYGITKLRNHKKVLLYSVYSKTFLILLLTVSSIISFQHLRPTAISQFKTETLKKSNQKTVICSNHLINYYLSKHKGFKKVSFVRSDEKSPALKNYFNQNYIILSSVNLDKELGVKSKEHFIFYHNPYVNRLWHTIHLYVYKKR